MKIIATKFDERGRRVEGQPVDLLTFQDDHGNQYTLMERDPGTVTLSLDEPGDARTHGINLMLLPRGANSVDLQPAARGL